MNKIILGDIYYCIDLGVPVKPIGREEGFNEYRRYHCFNFKDKRFDWSVPHCNLIPLVPDSKSLIKVLYEKG